MKKICASLMMLAALMGIAEAQVTEVSDNGFLSTHVEELPIPPAEAWSLLTDGLNRWWDASHSYSARGENLSLEARAGGCLCEQLDNGGWVEHLRVIYFEPEKKLRLQGALGPLVDMGLQGVMLWTLEPLDNGGTRFTSSYRVSGHLAGGFEQLAPVVHGVNGGHFERLGRVAAGQTP